MYEYNRINPEELSHFGTLGMRWGTRRGQKEINKLTKKIDKSVKRFDNGSRRITANTFRDHSRVSRKQTYKANKRIARMEKYLNQVKGESVNNLLFKWEKNPKKVAQVKDYLAKTQIQTKKLSELRTSLVDVKLDLM